MNRVEHSRSWRPRVTWVGAAILPSCAEASWPRTASDWRRNASTSGMGRLRTNSASESMYSGLAAYSSGVKHQGKMPRITMSVTLPSPLASSRQLSTTVRRNGSVLGRALCRDSVLTFSVWLAGLAGAAKVDRDAGVVLGVVGHLEGVAGLVDGEVGDEHHWFPGALLLVVDVDVVGAHCWHATLPVDSPSVLGVDQPQLQPPGGAAGQAHALQARYIAGGLRCEYLLRPLRQSRRLPGG